MKSEENIDLNITQDGLRFSGIYSLKIKDANNRKRMYASLIILNSLANFFMQQNLKVSNTKSVYKVAKLSEEYEITDLYVNNWRLDLRLAMPDDSFYIPISHFENEILPDFYVIATIDKDLKKPQFIGYVSPKNLKYEKYNSLYYKSNFDELKDMSDLIQELRNENPVVENEKDHKFFNTKILSYLDDEADNFTKSKLIHHILTCQACRTELINFCGFDMIATNLENCTDLFEDESLNIIGALKAQDDEDDEEEEAIKHQKEQEEREERIKNINKEKNDVLLDGLFENTPKNIKQKPQSPETNISEDRIEILPEEKKTDDTRVKINEDDIFMQDIPKLEETMYEMQTHPQNTQSEETNSGAEQYQAPVKQSLADSLKDIPDEMFNNEFETKPIVKKSRQHNSAAIKTEKVIVDYDEFGQPIYQEEKSDDYTIFEGEGTDTYGKPKESSPDITDTFTKDKNSNVIESSGENVEEGLISKIPPQTKNEPTKNKYLIYILIAVLAIYGVFSLVNLYKQRPKERSQEMQSIMKSNEPKGLDTKIMNRINNQTGFVRIKNVNWVAQKSLLTDSDFKNYLQIADKRFKTKFKLNTNSITQAPYNNDVIVEVILTPKGLIKTSRFAESSGVPAIDEAILQSLREAINSIPIPETTQEALKLDEYYIKLVIKL